MATEQNRVLIEIITAANMAGVEQAQKSMLGLNASTVALAAVLGAAIFVGRAAVDNYGAQETAANDLTQAYATQGDTLQAHQAQIEQFLQTNKRFISDQYDAEAAMAVIVRAGNNETDSFRLLNDALDLSVIKHESVADAAKALILVEAGNGKALKELGISQQEYSAIMLNKTLTVEQKHDALLTLIESHTNKGRSAVDNMSQSQRALNKDWQDFTTTLGPGVTAALDDLFQAADTGVGILQVLDDLMVKMGNDSRVFTEVMDKILSLVPGGALVSGLIHMPANQTSPQGPNSGRNATGGQIGGQTQQSVKVTVSLDQGLVAKTVSRNLQKIGAV